MRKIENIEEKLNQVFPLVILEGHQDNLQAFHRFNIWIRKPKFGFEVMACWRLHVCL
jgi:hypothetical protein